MKGVVFCVFGWCAMAFGQLGDQISPKEIPLGRAYIRVLMDERNTDYINSNGSPSQAEQAETARLEAQMTLVAKRESSSARSFADLRLVQILDAAKTTLTIDLVNLRIAEMNAAIAGGAPPAAPQFLRSASCLALAKQSLDLGVFQGWRVADATISDCLDLPVDASLKEINDAMLGILRQFVVENQKGRNAR